MAHMIDKMAYVGETPWHGLGNVMQADASIDQWRIDAGLDFDVVETPVLYNNGVDTVQASGNKVLFRSDRKDTVLGVVSDRYNVVQPATIMDFYKDFTTNHGFRMDTAGSLADGRKIWALAQVGDSFRIKGQDEVAPYVLMATSYDKTMATRIMFTTVRVVCNNTLQFAVQADNAGITVPHSTVMDKRKVMVDLGLMWDDINAMRDSIDVLADVKVDTKTATKIIAKALFDMDISEDSDQEISTRKANIIKGVVGLYNGNGIGSNLKAAEGTAWGVVNAVTQFVDHSQGRTASTRMNNAWFGQGANTKQRVWDAAMALAA